jgi:hypothetical protein
MNSAPKPLASISFNLDNKWSYLQMHGDAGWRWFPTYLEILVPRVLTFLRERNLRITFFVTGQDAAMPEHRDLIRSIAQDGHELANYSFHNEPWLSSYCVDSLHSEIARAEEQIEETSGYHPVGFRAPGFTISHDILQVIAQRGYLYDSSTLPTYLTGVARSYLFNVARFSGSDGKQREKSSWGWRNARRPLRGYLWQLGENELLEIPVTAVPGIRMPLQVSHVLSLSRSSRTLAKSYFRMGMSLCTITGIQPSLLLNPCDFISAETAPECGFLPTMNMPLSEKLETTAALVDLFRARYNTVTLREHAVELSKRSDLAHFEPQYLWK